MVSEERIIYKDVARSTESNTNHTSSTLKRDTQLDIEDGHLFATAIELSVDDYLTVGIERANTVEKEV